MAANIKVAILEDHQIVIDGYFYRLQNLPEFECVGTARVYSEWEPLLAANPPDVALMDVRVPASPNDPGPYPILHVMPRLVRAYPETAFLVISAFPEPTLVRGVMEAGACGYLLKDDNALLQELPRVLQSVVADRGIYLSPQAQRQAFQRFTPKAEGGLSPRQLEALQLCAASPSSSIKGLAVKMELAPSTVRNLLSQAYLKLGVNNRLAAVLKAQELGLIPRLEAVTAAEETPARPQSF
jgi:DNA-binding NarL/FixJ family response regulator